MLKNNKLKLLFLSIILFIISFIFIVIKGNTYEIKEKVNNISDINDIDIKVEQDKNIIKIVKKDIDNNVLKVKIKGINKGYAYISINNKMDKYYVHNFNVITRNEFLGESSDDQIILISIIILIVYSIYLMFKKYKNSINDNLYQYKNIFYLGIILFLLLMLIKNILSFSDNRGINYLIENIIYSSHMSVYLLPIIFLSFIIVTISNIKLLIKEGFSLKNMLGVLLGFSLCFLTLLPELMYQFTYIGFLINIHNTNSISFYIYTYVETFIYIIATYLECILFGTIILAIKASLHKPKLDKDYIIILGCKIKNDGSLTPLLRGRVDKAIEFYKLQKEKNGKELIFIPSGGKGADEIISEGEAIRNYLIEKGIRKDLIIVEKKSRNTYENIKFSYKLINKDSKILFSTTKYHVFRAGIIATMQNIKIEGIGSTTKSYFWVNAFIREFIATLFSEKKKHILVLIIISIISLIMIILLSISHNI